MPRLAQVILTAWAGSLWAVCGFAPLLFLNFERTLAGNVAALLFRVEAWVAAVLGAAYILVRARAGAPLEQRMRWIALITIAAPLTFYVVLRPLMIAARAAGDSARAGMLHSTSSVLFLAACLGALLLVLRQDSAAPPHA